MEVFLLVNLLAMNDSGTIICNINGRDVVLTAGTTLVDFLNTRNVPLAGIVVEYNREVLPKGNYDGIILKEGDMLEIIQIIGGG